MDSRGGGDGRFRVGTEGQDGGCDREKNTGAEAGVERKLLPVAYSEGIRCRLRFTCRSQ